MHFKTREELALNKHFSETVERAFLIILLSIIRLPQLNFAHPCPKIPFGLKFFLFKNTNNKRPVRKGLIDLQPQSLATT